MKIEDTEALGR